MAIRLSCSARGVCACGAGCGQDGATDAVPANGGADEEFYRLARVLAQPLPFLLIATLYKAPEKPQDGMIVKADGTHWIQVPALGRLHVR